jgi:D-amino-acid oxidase
MALVDEFIYMIPRMDGSVALGGTYESDREVLDPEKPTIDRILDGLTKLIPELGTRESLEILGHSVGLRPGRHGGPRLELERRGNLLLLCCDTLQR